MARMSSALWVAAIAGCGVWSVPATAAEDLRLAPKQSWSCAFGETDLQLQFTLHSHQAFRGLAVWSAHINQRIVARGESALESNAAKLGQLAISFKTPKVRQGVILPIEMSISVSPRPGEAPAASHKQTLWVFPDNPFSDRTGWLEDLKITLFDPQGATAERFQESKIPFHAVRTTAALRASKPGTIVIGEAASLTVHRDLAETLLSLSANGRRIVCLAPAAGLLSVPDAGELPPPLPTLNLSGPEAIARLDKRLDTQAWLGVENPVASSLSWSMQRGRLAAEFVEEDRGWPWVDIGYPANDGRLVVCGFGLIRHWETGPVPRYLFASLLEHVQQAGHWNDSKHLEEGGNQ